MSSSTALQGEREDRARTRRDPRPRTAACPADAFCRKKGWRRRLPPVFLPPSRPGPSSSRVCFPERILEDSGFDEQQEFSVSVQQRHGGPAKESSREQPEAAARRHASAPSHVQPSDSEKEQNHAVSGAVLAGGSPVFPSFAMAGSSPAASFSLVLNLEASNFCHVPQAAEKAGWRKSKGQ